MEAKLDIKTLYQKLLMDATVGFQLFAMVRQGTALIISIILAKSTLSIYSIGVYESWMYLGLFFMFFGISGCLQALTSLYYKLPESERGPALTTVYVMLLLLVCFVALWLIILKDYVIQQLFNTTEIPQYVLAIVFLALHFSASIFPFILLLKRKPNYFLPVSLAYFLLNTLAISVPLLLGFGLDVIIQGLIFFAIVEHLFIWYLLPGNVMVKKFSFLAPFFKVAIPLVVYLGIGYLAQLFDAWLVNWQYGSMEIFAVFRYGARELPGALALAGSFTTATIVILTRDADAGLARIKKGTRRFLHIFFPLAIFLTLCSHDLFSWIYNASFAQSAFVFNTYLLLLISRWFFPQAILIAKEDNRTLVLASIFELTLNVIISFALVHRLGLVGIALGTAIAYLLEKCLLIYFVSVRHGISLGEYIPLRLLSAYTLSLLGVYFFTLYWFGFTTS